MRHHRTLLLLPMLLLLVSSIDTAARPDPADAAVANRLVNGDFENRYDPPSESHFEADDWIETNYDLMATGLGNKFTVESGQTPSHAISNGSVGSIYAATPDRDSSTEYAVVLIPDPNHADNPPVIAQEIPTKFLAGRNPTISGYWYRSTGSSLGIKVTLMYATTSGSGLSEVGVWNTTNCDYTDTTFPSPPAWESFSFSCDSALPSEKIWSPTLVLEPTGTFGSGYAVAFDDVSVSADDALTFTAGAWDTGKDFTTIPSDADLIGVSKQYDTDPASAANGVTREVYAVSNDGSGDTRLTDISEGTQRGHANVVTNPIDRTQVAAGRYVLDWNGDDVLNPLVDPIQLFVLDLDEDKEKAITPVYWSAGLGGVEWTSDGRYIVFGVDGGGSWELWKADTTDNYALSKVTTDDDACFESDVNTTNYGHGIVYRLAPKVNDNCYPGDTQGQIEVVNLDAPATTQATIWEPNITDCGYAHFPDLCLSDDGLPLGIYDPGFLHDDLTIIFSNSVQDGDELCSDNDTYDAYETETISVAGTNRTCLFTHASIQDLAGDWLWSLAPFAQWNPSVSAANQAVAYEIEHDDVNGFTYWGFATFDPSDGSDYTRRDATGDGGIGHPRIIVGGNHGAAANSGTAFSSATNVYEWDLTEATATDAENKTHVFSDFNIEDSVPIGASPTIDGIRVGFNGSRVSTTSWTPKAQVELSWNNGSSWSSVRSTAAWTTTSQNLHAGSPTDGWGRTWSASELDDLQVRVKFVCTPSTWCPTKDWYLDHLSVRVFWRP